MSQSPLESVIGTIMGEPPKTSSQKAVSFRIDFDNYVGLISLQSLISNKDVSRNQFLNDLLAVAIAEVVSSLPDPAADAYAHAYDNNHEGLQMVLEQEGQL